MTAGSQETEVVDQAVVEEVCYTLPALEDKGMRVRHMGQE